MDKIKNYSLYLVLSSEYNKKINPLTLAQRAIAGGIDVLQMREKNKSPSQLVCLGRKLARICKKNKVIFIVNDDPFLVKKVSAAGVHLGQEDIKKYPIVQTRKIIGKNKIIGISTHSFKQFNQANESDVDYIAFGPIFPTKTKNYSIGTRDVRRVIKIAKKPVIFIGGIDLVNIEGLLKQGVKNIALIRAIIQAKDVSRAVKLFKDKINAYKN